MQSINNNQNSYTASIATSVFECEDLQNVLCSYLDDWQKTCLLSTNKTLEPVRWTQNFSFGKDKVKVAAFKELIYKIDPLETAKQECEDKVANDGRSLLRKSLYGPYSEKGKDYMKMYKHDGWSSVTTELFRELIITQFDMLYYDGKILKNMDFEGISIARIKLQALSWFSSSAWEAEQILKNSENLNSALDEIKKMEFNIGLQYPEHPLKRNKFNNNAYNEEADF